MKLNPFGSSDPSEVQTNMEAEPSEVRFRQWLLILLLTAGPILLLLLYMHLAVNGLVNADAMDYAQLGRNLMGGHGLTTQILRPLALRYEPNPLAHNALAQPDVTHGPLYPFVLALAFGMLGAKDNVVLGVSGLFYVLTVPLLFLLGQRLFNRTVGLISALVFMVSEAVLGNAALGTPVMFTVFLTTCLFLAVFSVATAAQNEEEKLPRTPLTLTGILAGLLYLTDPNFFWLMPVLLISVWVLNPSRRIVATLWFLIPWLILAVPCMIRFASLTGNPIFGLRGAEFWMGTEQYPGINGYRLQPDETVSDQALFRGIMRKLLLAATTGLTNFQALPGIWVLIFLVPGLFFPFRNQAINNLRRIILACMLTVFFGSMFLTLNPLLLIPFIPALLIYATAYLVHVIDQARLKRSSITWVAILLGAALISPMIAALVSLREPYTVRAATVARDMGQRSGKDEISFSSQPWLVAWYADRSSIWIPQNTNRITELRKQFPKANWLFLTSDVRSLSPEWDAVYSTLYNWSRLYQAQQQKNQTLPQEFRITRNPQLPPIAEILDGFTSVPPVEKESPSAVVAVAKEPSS